jgi:hypothetical protein
LLDAKIHTTSDKLCSFELRSIICQNSFWHVESVYDALQELDCCLLGYIYCWHDFHSFSERGNSDEQISETTWWLGQDAHDVNSPDCKRPRDINRSKSIDMLHCLHLKELAISVFLYDFHCVILPCMSALPTIEHHDECDPHTPLCTSFSSFMPLSL